MLYCAKIIHQLYFYRLCFLVVKMDIVIIDLLQSILSDIHTTIPEDMISPRVEAPIGSNRPQAHKVRWALRSYLEAHHDLGAHSGTQDLTCYLYSFPNIIYYY